MNGDSSNTTLRCWLWLFRGERDSHELGDSDESGGDGAAHRAHRGYAVRQSRRPAWLSEHVHAFAWLAAAIVVMALYISIHAVLRCDYIKEIRPQVRNAVELYVLRDHDVTSVLQLRVDDEPYRFDPDDAGPLGIGKLPEARGVLARAEAVIQHYNSALHDYIKVLTAAFYPWEDDMNYMVVPESALNPETEASSAAGVSRVFRVTVESFASVRHSYPNEQTLDAIVDMVRGADLVELQAGTLPKVVARAEGAEAVIAAAEWISQKRDRLRQEVSRLFETPGATACPILAAAKGCACPKTKRSGSALEETQFHRDLRTVVEGNIGFFWAMGDFLWYEIMMLAVLGVVTRKLVVFATDYASGRRDQRDTSAEDDAKPLIWQPRESVRTLMQLVAAPIFSLVIIWILTLTNIISVKPLIGDTWSNGFVPIAFLLGLFPSLGYEALHGLAEGVFGRRLVDEKAPKGNPQPILGAPPDAPVGTAASFDRLRQRVRHHAMAVFER